MLFRKLAKDFIYVFFKAHVQNFVGFVDNKGRYLREVKSATTFEV